MLPVAALHRFLIAAAIGAVLWAIASARGGESASVCPPARGWAELRAPEGARVVRGKTFPGTLTIATSWADPGQLYAGGFGGLYRSDDCGNGWLILPHPWMFSEAVETVATTRSGALLLGRSYDFIVVSPDGGQSWEEASGSNPRSRHLAASPAGGGVVYAVFHQVSLRGTQGIARSDDGGHTWRVQPKSFTLGPVAADALDPDTVYFVSSGLWRSRDTGARFERIESFTPHLAPGDGVSALTMSPDGARFWVASTRGNLFRSPDRGETWEQVQNTAYAGHLVDLSASPFDSRVLFGLTNTGALWAYREPERGELPLERSCQFDAVLGFGRIWRTETLPRGDAGCPLESERPVAIYQMPSTELERYRIDYTPDYWLYVFGDGSWSTFDKATHPLPPAGVTAIFGSIQGFEAATMVWVPKPDGSRAILVLQDILRSGTWQEFAD